MMYMRKQLLFIPILATLIGCKELGVGDDPGFGKACTLVGSATAIKVHVTSAAPLPSNLALSLNGNDVDADECVNGGLFSSSVTVSADRMEAEVLFQLNGNPDDFEFYFPNNSTEPQSNLMDLGFYDRATCADTHAKFDEVDGTQVSWQPVYANGEDCAASSHVAEGSAQTH